MDKHKEIVQDITNAIDVLEKVESMYFLKGTPEGKAESRRVRLLISLLINALSAYTEKQSFINGYKLVMLLHLIEKYL